MRTPGPIVPANASVTSRQIGIGHSTPLASRMSEQTGA